MHIWSYMHIISMYLIIILSSPPNLHELPQGNSLFICPKRCKELCRLATQRGSGFQDTIGKANTSEVWDKSEFDKIREFFKGMLFKFFWQVLFDDKEGDEHSFVPLQVKMHLMKCLKIKSATYLSVENKENNSWVSGHPHVPLDMYVTLEPRFLGKMYGTPLLNQCLWDRTFVLRKGALRTHTVRFLGWQMMIWPRCAQQTTDSCRLTETNCTCFK